MLSKLQNVDSSNPDEVTNIFKNDNGLDVDKIIYYYHPFHVAL